MTTTAVSSPPTLFRPIRLLDSFARTRVLGALDSLRGGCLTIEDAHGVVTAGDDSAGLAATVSVNDPRFYRSALLGGFDAIDDAYLDGVWDCDDLTALFRLFARNLEASNGLSSRWAGLARWCVRLAHRARRNTESGSRANIRAHYDLGNDFFRLWLDDTLAYSSGVFRSFDDTLHEASVEKFDRVCRKLDLQANDHLLEIGSGWGGFALHAASRYGCRITTTTISRQQYDVACERVRAAGLEDRVEILLTDYRDLSGQYDKLASIEMVEAVGHEFFDDYFRQCGRLLRPHGSFVIQAIVMPERRYASYLKSVDFIQRHVFPGGCLPSVAAMLESIGRTTDLRLSHLEDFSPHYAETLRRWQRAFSDRLDEVRALGYPERFQRLWRYYLCYCEAVFEEREVGVVQMHFDKPGCRQDPLHVGARAAVPGAAPVGESASGVSCR